MSIKLKQNQMFKSRRDISLLLGGDIQKGISNSNMINAIILIANDDEIYTDYFFPKNTYDYCMYTGIGRFGHQDSINNNMYNLNMSVLTHTKENKQLLMFEKRNDAYYFIGEYKLLETHQNVQPDVNNNLRRVFVFHLKKLADIYEKK